MEGRLQIFINPIACKGHGMCAELLPVLIELDEWGFPLIKKRDVPLSLIDHARRAERLCPTLALILKQD